MNLYLCHDDPAESREPEQRATAFVWAASALDAGNIAMTVIPGVSDVMALFMVLLHSGGPYAPAVPGIEARPHVLRLAGAAQSGESLCTECDLASFGMKEHKLCPNCGQCPGCVGYAPCGNCGCCVKCCQCNGFPFVVQDIV